jgi:hypothetical protein
MPSQFQVQGPVPVTAEAVTPSPQRLVVGAAFRVWPLAIPQVPLTGVVVVEDLLTLAVHCAVVPPPMPSQLHL